MYNVMSELNSSVWNHPNPSQCPCGGGGWMLSDFDTWHSCYTHNIGQTHPETDQDMYEDDAISAEAHDRHDAAEAAMSLQVDRDAYRYYLDEAKECGLDGLKVRSIAERYARAENGDTDPTRRQWIDAAEKVASEVVYEHLDERARRAGYSCRLEAALDAEAQVEASARYLGVEPEQYAPYGSPEAAHRDSWYWQ